MIVKIIQNLGNRMEKIQETFNEDPEELKEIMFKELKVEDFPGGTVVKNPTAHAGDTGSIPGPGRSHMPQSN